MNVLRRMISILLMASIAAWPLPTFSQTGGLNCSSNDGKYRYCRADTQNQVRLVRQLSGSPCRQGYSWGYDYRGIWVDRGCRAEFEYGRRQDNGSNTGAAIAAGILGAIIVGAVVANSKSDKNHDDDDTAWKRRDYYRDGYRHGARDWDNNLSPYYQAYHDRYPREFERDFANGYDDGYNNRPDRYR